MLAKTYLEVYTSNAEI